MKTDNTNIAERLKKRFGVLVYLFLAAMAVIAISLFFIEIFNGKSYARTTLNRSQSVSAITARRGDILDRNNVLLATSTLEYKLILDPVVITTDGSNFLDITSRLIEKCFGVSAVEVKQKTADNPDSRYIVLRNALTYNDVKEFAEMMEADSKTIKAFLNLKDDYDGVIEAGGAWLEENYRRNYTYDTFACSVLGFLSGDTGQYGVEKYYNAELSGINGKKYTYLNNDNLVENKYTEARDGDTIQLTIDYNIQSIVEKYVMNMLEESGAKKIAVTIQNPDTGEFLSMADSGIFDPNNPRDLSVRYSEEEVKRIHEDDELTRDVLSENWSNYCISSSFEPGSTFKAFTVAAGLEEGVISEDDIFNCDGSVSMMDYIIHCADIDGHGEITLTDALAQSCNMAMMDIAAEEGVDIFSKYQDKFGFGPLTDIDLPNETNSLSLMHTRENMTDLDLATYSFGQGFNVTMVQMSSAFCSLVNGGTYYKPFITKGIYNSDGDLIKSFGKTVVSRPVSQETCDFVKDALRRVVTDGTGTEAVVPGYITAGKTGTAQKGSREEDLWVASFIGFAPYEDPQVVCYVVIDEPALGGDGSSILACELFSQIMSEVLPYINAVPADMDYDPTGKGSPYEEELQDVGDEEEDKDDEDEEDEEEDDGEEDEDEDEDSEADGDDGEGNEDFENEDEYYEDEDAGIEPEEDYEDYNEGYEAYEEGYEDYIEDYEAYEEGYEDYEEGYEAYEEGYENYEEGYEDYNESYEDYEEGYGNYGNDENILDVGYLEDAGYYSWDETYDWEEGYEEY